MSNVIKSHPKQLNGSLCGEVANELYSDILVYEFKLQLFYYTWFWTNILGKDVV